MKQGPIFYKAKGQRKFLKWANLGLFFGLFKQTVQFLQQINAKNIHPLISTRPIHQLALSDYSRLDSAAARQAVDRSVIVPYNCHYNQNGWLKYNHRGMYKKYATPLPSYGMKG